MASPWVRIKKNGNPHQNHVVSMCCSNIKKNYVRFARQNDFLYAFLWLLFWYYLHRILYFAQKWSNFPSEHRLKCHLFCARCATRNVRLSYLWTWCNASPGIYIWLRKDEGFFSTEKEIEKSDYIFIMIWFVGELVVKVKLCPLEMVLLFRKCFFFCKYVVLLRFNADL